MASYINTDGFRDDKYFARSWALLTRDPGWIKPVLGMWLAGLIPFVGPLGVTGYIVEWARLTAWGVSSAPKQRDIQIGACIKSGWRAFLVSLLWGLLWMLAGMALALIPLIGAVASPVFSILGIVFSLIVHIAMLRSAIYQSVSGGMPGSTLFQMIENDFGGLLRILGIMLLGGLVVGFFSAIVFGIAVIPSTVSFVTGSISLGDLDIEKAIYNEEVLRLIATWLVSMVPGMLIAAFIVSFITNILEMIVFTAIGLWMRQYNVPAWGGPSDPLPGTAPAYAQYTPPQQPQYGAYVDPSAAQQVPYGYGDTDYGQTTHGGVGQTFSSQQGPDQQ